MKYVHGTDEKAHDLLMIWVNNNSWVFLIWEDKDEHLG